MSFWTNLIGARVRILEGMNEGLTGVIRTVRFADDGKVWYTVQVIHKVGDDNLQDYTSKDFTILKEAK